MAKLALEIIGLQTPRGRLIFFVLASLLIFSVPYDALSELSLWQRLGIQSPSIGLTRAYWQVLHLDISAAWQRNPLIFLVMGLGIPLLLRDCFLVYKKSTGRAS